MPQTSEGQSTAGKRKPRPEELYTAVVYFHGMGTQRRYEEVSSLLSQLDNLVFQQRGGAQPRYLDLRPITLEPGRADSGMTGKPVGYYEVVNPYPASDPTNRDRSPTVRFYEAYWANHTAGGTNALSTLNWVVRQWRRPLSVLLAAWGEVGALRVGTLYDMYQREQEQCRAKGQELRPERVQLYSYLITAYRLFIRSDTRYNDVHEDRYQGSSFNDFCAFLDDDINQRSFHDIEHNAFASLVFDANSVANGEIDQPAFANEVQRMARRWRWSDTFAQVRYLLITLSLLISLITVTMLVVGIVYLVATILFQINSGFLQQIIESIPPFLFTTVWQIIIAVAFVLVGLSVYSNLKSFFSDYMGDVHNYLTYQETDIKYERREAILQDSKALLVHVMQDERCERIVVVAHSLGSVIAYDTLLELRRLEWVQRQGETTWEESLDLTDGTPGATPRNQQTLRLDKIKHFVTMGSPIDKVVYFFAALQSKVPHFVETIAALRGDISQPPFTWVDKENNTIRPHIHWVNYWDRADVISGPIRNIVGTRFLHERVDNVRVASLSIPHPSYSHGGYFDNRDVLQDIFDIAFDNKYSFVAVDNTPRQQQWFADKPVYRRESRRLYLIQRWSQMGVVYGFLFLLMGGLWVVLPFVVKLLGVLFGLFALGIAVVFIVRQRRDPSTSGTWLHSRRSVDPREPRRPRDQADVAPASVELTEQQALEQFLQEPVPSEESAMLLKTPSPQRSHPPESQRR